MSDNEHAEAALDKLTKAIREYRAAFVPDGYVDGWILITHTLTPDGERDGGSLISSVTPPDQTMVITRGLLDIAITGDRGRQA